MSITTAIPPELRQRDQWLTWSNVQGRKIPNGKSNDSETWSDFASIEICDNIAFVIAEDDPYTGIDLDGCIVDGQWAEWAKPILERFQGVAYCEVSPSGSGVKLTTMAKKPAGSRCTHKIGEDKQQIECYDHARFWTVTGNVVSGFETIGDGQEAVDWLCKTYLAGDTRKTGKRAPAALLPSLKLLRRAQAYSNKMAAAGVGDLRNAAFRNAGHLHAIVGDAGERLAVTDVYHLLREWNARNAKPLRDEELYEAATNGRKNGTPPADKLPAKATAETKPRAEPYFQPITAAELDAGDFSLNYLIPGILCEHQPLIVAGQSKSLKTTLLLDAAISLASGTQFLGRFNAEPRNVFVLTAESGMGTVQETCRRICRSRGRTLSSIENLIFDKRVPQFTNAAHMAELADLLKARGTEVLIIDPAYLCLEGADAGNLFLMGSQLRLLAELAAEANCTPVLIHHAKKSAGNAIEYQPLELQDIAWAGFSEFARQWLLLSRRERYAEGTGEHRLWLTAGGSAGHSGCWGVDAMEGSPDDEGGRRWDVSVSTASETRETAQERHEREKDERREQRQQAKLAMNRGKIRAAFRGEPSLTKRDIAERAGLSNVPATEAIGAMLRDGELVASMVLKSNGQEYEGYAIQEAQNQ